MYECAVEPHWPSPNAGRPATVRRRRDLGSEKGEGGAQLRSAYSGAQAPATQQAANAARRGSTAVAGGTARATANTGTTRQTAASQSVTPGAASPFGTKWYSHLFKQSQSAAAGR